MKQVVTWGAVVVLTALFLTASSCHNEDITPLIIEGGDTGTIWDDEEEEEVLTTDQQTKRVVEGLADEMNVITADILRTMGFLSMYTGPNSPGIKAAKVRSRFEIGHHAVSMTKNGSEGGYVTVTGSGVDITNLYGHCVTHMEVALDFVSYAPSKDITIDGSGIARVIASSYACKYYLNTHLDVSMLGGFVASGVTVQELIFSADYTRNYKGLTVRIDSSEADTDKGPRYCLPDINGETDCFADDLRKSEHYCASDEDVCTINASGHASCMRPEYEDAGAHCDLGCCGMFAPHTNTCNDHPLARRECNPLVDTFYTQKYFFEGELLLTYETALWCSEDGVWTPPCPLDGSVNTCPFNGTCRPPDDKGWGRGLEDYGFCTCTGGDH